MIRALCISMALVALAVPANAGERAAQLVNSFQVMCMLEPLDFARSDEKATAMKLAVRQDIHPPVDASGYFSRAKSWLLPLKSGPHEFSIAEARGPNGDVKTCGIGAPDVDADDFRGEVTKTMHLGRPKSVSKSNDGQFRNTVWQLAGDQRTLLLSDGSPRNMPHGIYFLLLNKSSVR